MPQSTLPLAPGRAGVYRGPPLVPVSCWVLKGSRSRFGRRSVATQVGVVAALFLSGPLATNAVAQSPQVQPPCTLATPAPTLPPAASQLESQPEPESESEPEEEFLPRLPANRSLQSRWSVAVDSVAAKIASKERVPADADALFVELVADLRREIESFGDRIREDGRATPRVIEAYDGVREMYDTRLRLLGLTTEKFHAAATGAGLPGLRELHMELRYGAMQVVYQTLQVPHDVTRYIRDARVAPLPVVLSALELFVAFAVFFGWRRWAKRELPMIQARLRLARSRDPSFGRMERIVGFLRQVREPVEWLALAALVFFLLNLGSVAVFEAVAWTVIRWLLLAWLAVRVGQALLSGRLGSSDEELERLRARSLGVSAAWLLVIGMGLAVGEDVVGKGTLYAWIWRAFLVLTVPTVVILLVWWRSRIFEALEKETERSSFAQQLVGKRTGLSGIIAAAFGLVYLLIVRGAMRVLRGMENFDGGRRTLAALTQFEMVVAPLHDSESEEEPASPISEDLQRRIVDSEVEDIEGVGAGIVDAIEARFDRNNSAMIIVGERGAGKTHILRQVKKKLGDKVHIFECPAGGYDAFQAALAETVGVDETDLTPAAVASWIEKTGTGMFIFDDVHRVVKAAMGESAVLAGLASFLRGVDSRASWIFSMDAAAVKYFLALRGNATASNVVVPRWSEAQIRQYIERKCSAVGIEFDVSDFRVPRYLELEHGTAGGDRRKRGFYRLLWHASEGNPESALQAFVNSLRTGTGREFFVREIREPSGEELEKQSLTTLLILKFIIQCEYATTDDIARGLGVPPLQVVDGLAVAISNGWIAVDDGRCRVSSRWFQTLSGYLKRRNLMSSSGMERFQ